MTQPVLIPVDQSTVHPSLTVAEVIEELLAASGAKRETIHFSLSSEAEGPDGVGSIELTAAARRQFDYKEIAAAARVVIDALHYGRLDAYARDEIDRQHYRIARNYWRDLSIEDEEPCLKVVPPASLKDADWREGVLGQVILIPASEFEAWKRAGLSALGVETALKQPSGAAIRDYVRASIRKGLGKEATSARQALIDAFPSNLPPGRKSVREVFDAEFKGEIRRGRPAA